MDTPVTTPATARRVVAIGLGTALLAAAAGIGASGPASAAPGVGWDPSRYNLSWVPTTAVDGEITVAAIRNDDAGSARALSFRRDGTPVQYATSYSAKALAWAPGGDALARVPAGFDTTVASPTPLEQVPSVDRPAPGSWSPFGESITTPARALGSNPFTIRATWVGSNRSEALTRASSEDPGVGAPTPDGVAMVVTVRNATTGLRDLATVDVDLPRSGNPTWNTALNGPVPLGYSTLDAHDPVVSNDGTLAFLGTSTDTNTGTGTRGNALFVVEGDAGPVQVAELGATCDGQRPVFSPSGRSLAFVKASAGCTASELTVLDKVGDSFVGGTETAVVSTTDLPAPSDAVHFASASWRAKTPRATTTRLGGSDRVATGIAVSRDGWLDGSNGAIIASSQSFPDALVAGPLAAAADYPLLINPTAKLDPRVLAELKRLMPGTSRRVYIVGGTGVVSSTVQDTLTANGFAVSRLSGTDRFRTSVRVAQELDKGYQYLEGTLTRDSVFLADGMNFPDALAAGPAAATFFAPVLLSNGPTTPDVVRSYVNGRTTIRAVHAIGGMAATAVGTFGQRTGERIVGADRYATSAQVAQRWFPGATRVGYANGTTFPDAVTGGALMSAHREPLLLVGATAVPAPVNLVSRAFRTATDDATVFGGSAVVSEGVRTQVGSNAGAQTALWGPDVPSRPNPLSAAAPGAAATKVAAQEFAERDSRGAGSDPRVRPTFRTPIPAQ